MFNQWKGGPRLLFEVLLAGGLLSYKGNCCTQQEMVHTIHLSNKSGSSGSSRWWFSLINTLRRFLSLGWPVKLFHSNRGTNSVKATDHLKFVFLTSSVNQDDGLMHWFAYTFSTFSYTTTAFSTTEISRRQVRNVLYQDMQKICEFMSILLPMSYCLFEIFYREKEYNKSCVCFSDLLTKMPTTLMSWNTFNFSPIRTAQILQILVESEDSMSSVTLFTKMATRGLIWLTYF